MKPVFHIALAAVDHLEAALDTPLHAIRSAILVVALIVALLEATGSMHLGDAAAPAAHPASGVYPWTCAVPDDVPAEGASEYCAWVKEQAASKDRATESTAAPAPVTSAPAAATTAAGRQLAAASASSTHHRHAGTVTAISAASLSISQKSGKRFTFVLAADTVYLSHGRAIARASIVAGDYVSVTYATATGGQFVAWHVSKR